MNKHLGIAVLICAMLGLTYFVTRKDHVKEGVRELALPAFDPQAIDAIEIGSFDKVKLSRTNDSWQVVVINEGEEIRVPASEEYVSSLLNAALDIKHNYFVTEQADKLNEFNLSDLRAIQVRLWSGDKPVWQLLVGNDAEGVGKYVRIPNTDAVYVAKGRFWDLTRTLPDEWRDRKIMPFVAQDVTRLEVRGKDASPRFALSRHDKEWQIEGDTELPKNFRINDKRVAQVIETLANVRAHHFVDDMVTKKIANAQLMSPVVSLKAFDDKNGAYEFEATFSEDKKKIWARLKGRDQIYEISPYVLEQLNPSFDELSIATINPS